MNREMSTKALFVCAAMALAGVAAQAQQQQQQQTQPDQTQANQPGQFQGVSNPPADDAINAAQDQQQAKPPAGVPATQPAPAVSAPPAIPANSDAGTVQAMPPQQPILATRQPVYDPDGDIVHPAPLPPGTLEEGTRIFARMMTPLNSADNEKGDVFRSRVDADVIQGGMVVIPAGSEIDGKVVSASSGHFAGHGALQLRPETVILPNGAQFMIVAQVSGTPGEHTTVDGEGTINAGTRYKRDGVEYGGGVGAGVVAGAIIGGPVGALTGGLIGAGVVTAHLMLDHPQARLEQGSQVMFTLNSRLSIVAAPATGN